MWGAPAIGVARGARVQEHGRGDIQPPQQQGWDAAGGGSRQPNKRGLCADLAPRRLSIWALVNRQRPAGTAAKPTPAPAPRRVALGTAGANGAQVATPDPFSQPTPCTPSCASCRSSPALAGVVECKQMSALEGSRLLERGSGCPAGSGECSWAGDVS